MTIPSLFVQPVLQRTLLVSSPPVTVLSAQTNFSTIDSILVTNLMSLPIFVSIYISTNNFLVIPPTEVPGNSILQLLKEAYFSLATGETLTAKSDSSQNFFNINIEGRVFTEISY